MYSVRLLEEGTQGLGIWIVLGVLAVFTVMVLLGWLASTKGWLKKEAEPIHADESHHAAESHPEVESQHDEHAAPVLVKAKAIADDLTALEGIGPKVASLLAGIGIISFEGLAQADYAAVRSALDAAGYKYMEPAGWIEQATLAAKGDLEGLKKLQDSLKGGRKIS